MSDLIQELLDNNAFDDMRAECPECTNIEDEQYTCTTCWDGELEVSNIIHGLQKELKDCKERISQFDKVFREINTELGITYGGVDVDSGEIIEAIKLLIKQRDYFEQSHLTALKDLNVLHESLQEEVEKVSEYENDMDTLKEILHEVGGCDGEKGYSKGWDEAVDEIESQAIKHLAHFKTKEY